MKAEKRSFTCIVCPNGCEISVLYGKHADGSVSVCGAEGHACPRGEAYVRQEMEDPRRTIASSVPVENGELPLTSVRITRPIPKDRIFAAMEEIKKLRVAAPVEAGTVLIPQLLGFDTELIVTKSVGERAE